MLTNQYVERVLEAEKTLERKRVEMLSDRKQARYTRGEASVMRSLAAHIWEDMG